MRPARTRRRQRACVVAGLSRRCMLVRGPPGTGKTHTAVALVVAWLRAGIAPILVAAIMQMIGNDLNPVAWFVVKQELANVDLEQVKKLLADIEAEVKDYDPTAALIREPS